MNVKSVEKQEHNAVQMVIEISKEDFEAAVDKVYRKQRNSIVVHGFRKGKAPRSVIEGMYGTGVFYDEAINDLYPTAYDQAVEQENLDVVSHPSVEMIDVGRDGFTFKATVTVRPLGKIENYRGLSAPKKEYALTDEDIDTELKPYISRATRLVTAERPAKSGDVAVIDYEGFDSGVPFEGGKGEQHELELGSNSFIPGFEDQVIGMSAGEEKDLDITFPENYHEKSLAGKPVVFHVKLHEVKEHVAPELDDEFAKDVSEFDTLDELKKSLGDKLKERRERMAQQDYEEELLKKLIELMEVEIPDPMVDFQVDKMMDDYNMRLTSQGLSLEQYLQAMGITRENMREEIRENALKQVQGQLALEAVAAAEGIAVAAEELEEEFGKLAKEYNIELDKVKRYVPEKDMKGDLLRQKAMKVVTDSATVDNTVKSADEESKEDKSTEAKTEKSAGRTSKKVASAGSASEEKPKRKSSKKTADADQADVKDEE